jgi:hypothetical protein
MAESISLPLKTTTQTIIVRKLSAFALKNKTRRALWEYFLITLEGAHQFLMAAGAPAVRPLVVGGQPVLNPLL